MNDRPQEMGNIIDGKASLIEYVRRLHPNAHIPLAALLPGGEYALPLGFSLQDYDSERIVIAGPHEHVITVRTLSHFGGSVAVSGEQLTAGLMLAAHVGEPLWAGPEARKQWRLAQFEHAPAFDVTIPEPRTLEELKLHTDRCPLCSAVGAAYGRAVDSGMDTTDQTRALRKLVDLAHHSVTEAITYYDAKAEAHRKGWAPIAPDKPTRRPRRTPEVTT
ncbi:hypothetical protein YTPLAS18_17170 [Nitrospira sp.]|nr:hypothetical protein YTPLAS18_17170 [Nitrospira sp.]